MEIDKAKRFLMELENAIRAANREVIHTRIPAMTQGQILPFAVSVARLRARYLEAAFKFAEREHGEALDEGEINDLRRQREAYEEARKAFAELTHAIERGYVDLEGH